MKKYLGSKIDMFAATVAVLFASFPAIMAIFVLCSETSYATVFLAIMFFSCSVIWSLFIKSMCNQVYSRGHFAPDNVYIKPLFSKGYTLNYEKCNGCGIGFYTHGVLNSKIGKKVYYIFLSYESFDEAFRSRINLWTTSENRAKIAFSKKTYEYLIDVLPKKQRVMLQKDYTIFIKTGDGSLS